MEEDINDSDDNTASCSEDKKSYPTSNSNFERNDNHNNSNRTAQAKFNNFSFSENCPPKNIFLDKKDLKKKIGPTGRSGHQAVTAAIPIKLFAVDF